MKRKLFTSGLILLIFSTLLFSQQNKQQQDAFIPGLKGMGEREDIILISTQQDLDTLSYFVRQSKSNNCKGKFFKLKNDINFDTLTNFIPIGGRNFENKADSNFVFSGNFDGYYYTISKFTINDTLNYSGLFGYIKNATISRLKIKDATVIGQDYSAVLCGYGAAGSLLKNCSVISSLIDGNKYVATVLGYLALDATIMGCKYTGCNIFGKQNVGDICGYNENTNKTAKDKLNELHEKRY